MKMDDDILDDDGPDVVAENALCDAIIKAAHHNGSPNGVILGAAMGVVLKTARAIGLKDTQLIQTFSGFVKANPLTQPHKH